MFSKCWLNVGFLFTQIDKFDKFAKFVKFGKFGKLDKFSVLEF